MKANKIYVFDMGGVVLSNFDVEPKITEVLQISKDSFYRLAGPNLLLLSNGKIGVAEFWQRFSLAYGREVQEELFGKYFAPEINEEIVKVIKTLRKEARVVCGTNTVEPHFNYLQNRDAYQLFHAVYASNQIGMYPTSSRINKSNFCSCFSILTRSPERCFSVNSAAKSATL